MRLWLCVVVCGCAVQFVGAAEPEASRAIPLRIEEARVLVTGHDFNRPDPFPGAGDFGWAGNIQQTDDGRLMLVHQWGYWHSSFAEPRMIEPELAKRWRQQGWPLDFKAPTGGRSMITTSDDGGRTWSKPRTIIDLPQDDSPYGLLRLKDGTLLCFISVQASWYGYDKAPAELADTLDGLNTQQCVIRSTDDGRTWSDPIWLKGPGKFYERSHAQPVELADGAVLCPTYCLDARDGLEFGVIHRSDDSGKTWRVVSTVRRKDKRTDEPAIASLGDGQLIMVCRPDGGTFHSNDHGTTWKETGAISVSGTLKAPRLFVLSDGTIVCVASVGSLCAFISSDKGTSWTKAITLDGSAYGYPGGLKLADDSIVVSYVQRANAPSRIYVVRFRVNESRTGIEFVKIDDSTTVDRSKSKPSPPVRVADVIGGHIHPSLCTTESGDILAVYNESGGGGKELLLCRSSDGGRTWTKPAAIPVIKDCSIYPGSLTRLRDGRIVLHWSCYRVEGERRWRVPQYCISADEGKTWSDPRDLPIDDHTNYSCLRHPILELDDGQWVCPLYDRTLLYDPRTQTAEPFSDGRNHGMVPIVRTPKGTIISGAPQANAPVPVGKPGETVRGLRSTDGGKTWQALHALPYFGVAGYDLTVLDNGWIVLTSIVYGVGRDGEWSYELIVSRDDGLTWEHENAVEIYNPGRHIPGRGWPRTVQLDDQTLGTLFFDLDPNQPGGPGVYFVRTPIAALDE